MRTLPWHSMYLLWILPLKWLQVTAGHHSFAYFYWCCLELWLECGGCYLVRVSHAQFVYLSSECILGIWFTVQMFTHLLLILYVYICIQVCICILLSVYLVIHRLTFNLSLVFRLAIAIYMNIYSCILSVITTNIMQGHRKDFSSGPAVIGVRNC